MLPREFLINFNVVCPNPKRGVINIFIYGPFGLEDFIIVHCSENEPGNEDENKKPHRILKTHCQNDKFKENLLYQV